MSAIEREAEEIGAVERAVATRLRGGGQYVVLGESDLAIALLARHSDLFATREAAAASAGVLALGLDAETLAAASSTARELGRHVVLVVIDNERTGQPVSEPAIREQVRSAGLILAGLERLLWRQADGAAADTRLKRIDRETQLAIGRCVLADDPRAISELEAALSDLQRELDLQRQLQVEHAASREAERVREERLRELEARFDDYGGRGQGAEVERLRAEIAAMKATRAWRLGSRWWDIKKRLRPGGG